MAMIKAVIDTNVFARALIGSSVNKEIYNAFINSLFELVISKKMLEELADVLSRPQLEIPTKVVRDFFHLLIPRITITKPNIKIDVCRDPGDNIVLETAITANADTIVTSDNDLLILNPFRNISIVTPHKFLKRLHLFS